MKYLVHCEQPNCYMHMTVNTEEEQAHYLANHKCPYWGGESKVSWSVTKTLVEQMWDKLDAEMDALKGHWTKEDKWTMVRPVDPEYHKNRARAFAECLAIFMVPFFETADDIAREAVKRWEARRDSDSQYETAGLGNRRYETAAVASAAAYESAASGWYGTADDGYSSDPRRAGSPSVNRGRGAATRAATVAARGAATITEKDAQSMKMAYEGMPQIFTPAVLAKQYKYPEAAVITLLGLDTP